MFVIKKREQGQSAIEYLMTYGWAILIIGIVLAVLFKLGVFSSGSLLGISCTATPGFLCANPVLNTTGQMSVQIGQVSSGPLYDVELSCSAAFTSNGLPSNSMSWATIQANGLAVQGESATNATVLLSTQSLQVNGLPCYDATGVPLSSNTPVGTTFSGSLWINYTSSSCTPGTSGCTPQIQKFATVTARVV